MRAVSQETGGSGTGLPRPARRKPYSVIRKGLAEHIVSGRLRGTKLNVYLWLHLSANPYTGRCFMNAAMIALALGLPSRTVNHNLLQLRVGGYVDFIAMRGSRKPFEITIKKFHHHYLPCEEIAMRWRGGCDERPEKPLKSISTDDERIKNKELKRYIRINKEFKRSLRTKELKRYRSIRTKNKELKRSRYISEQDDSAKTKTENDLSNGFGTTPL